MICIPRRPPNSSTSPPAISASGAIAATITNAGVTSALAPLTKLPIPCALLGIPAALATIHTPAPGQMLAAAETAASTARVGGECGEKGLWGTRDTSGSRLVG